MISITYSTSTETGVTQEFSTATELKTFITNNNQNFTGAMKVVCDNSITDCTDMFFYCQNITSLDVSELDTSNVTTMEGMFRYCEKLTSLDLSNFNTSKVTSMTQMFYYCAKITSLDLSSFNTSNVTTMTNMFTRSGVKSVNLSSFNLGKVTDMAGLFDNTPLQSIDLSNLDFSHVNSLKNLFYNCYYLTRVTLSSLNALNATNIAQCFYNCRNLAYLNTSKIIVKKADDISYMFSGCSSLSTIDTSGFDTSQTRYFQGLFQNCRHLTTININNLDNSMARFVDYMFRYCDNLETIYCEQDWNVSTVASYYQMFSGCTKLKGAIPYDSSKTSVEYANPDTGYFSYLPLPPAITFLANLDMLQNQIKNLVLDKPKATPTDAVVGQIYYNKTDNILYIYNGTTWDKLLSSLVLSVNGKTGNVNITNADLGAESVGNKIAILSTQNTDIEYPNAKCVYDNFANKIKNATNTNLVIKKMWYGTQGEYDVLTSKDTTTLYLIKEG
jgi:surface protein